MSKLGKPREGKMRPFTAAEAMELEVGRGWAVKADREVEDGIVLFRHGQPTHVPHPELRMKLIQYWTSEAMTVRGFRLTDEQWKFCSRQYGGASAFVRRLIDREKAQAESMADEDERRRQEQAGVGARPLSGDTNNNTNDEETG